MKDYKLSKQNLMLLLTLMIICVFTGCAKNSNVANSEVVSQGSGTTGEKIALQMLIPDTIDYTPGAATADGYYYIEPLTNNSLAGQIRYIDYATGIDIPLSSQVNSEYSSEEDTSYIDSIIGQYRMFIWDDKLYAMRSGASWYIDNSDFGPLAASAIYQMDMDGSNRKEIYLGDSETELLMYAAACDHELYLIRQKVDIIEVFKINENGGEEKVIAEFPNGVALKLAGCAGEKMYFNRFCFDESKTDSTEEYQLTEMLTSLNVTNGEKKDLVNLFPSEAKLAQPFVTNGKLYLYYPNASQVDVCDLSGNVESSIPFNDEIAGMEIYSGRSANIIGTSIFVPCFDIKTNTGLNLVIDLGEGKITRSNVTIYRTDGKDIPPAQVVAETGNEYLVNTGYTIYSAKMPMGDGTTNTTELMLSEYSLIGKDNFCSEKLSSRKIERIA